MEANRLAQRVREGQLSQSKLETAAALGDSEALRATATLRGSEAEPSSEPPADLEEGKAAWLRLQSVPPAVELPYDQLDREAAARLALIALEVAQNLWRSEFPHWADMAKQGVMSDAGLEAVEKICPESTIQGVGEACHDWCLEDPQTRTQETVEARASSLRESIALVESSAETGAVDWPDYLGKQLVSLLTIALRACEAVVGDSPGAAVRELIDPNGRVLALVPDRAEEASRVMAEGHRRMVVPWLLGEGDPLR